MLEMGYHGRALALIPTQDKVNRWFPPKSVRARMGSKSLLVSRFSVLTHEETRNADLATEISAKEHTHRARNYA